MTGTNFFPTYMIIIPLIRKILKHFSQLFYLNNRRCTHAGTPRFFLPSQFMNGDVVSN